MHVYLQRKKKKLRKALKSLLNENIRICYPEINDCIFIQFFKLPDNDLLTLIIIIVHLMTQLKVHVWILERAELSVARAQTSVTHDIQQGELVSQK